MRRRYRRGGSAGGGAGGVAADRVARGPGRGAGGVVVGGDDPVGRVHVDDPGTVGAGGFVVHDRVREDDHQVAGRDQPGGGAVDADHAAAGLAGDHVRLQPRPVGDVDDRHLLTGQEVGRLHEVGVHGHRAHVVQVGLGHGGPVDL